jgi:hypothetical protein
MSENNPFAPEYSWTCYFVLVLFFLGVFVAWWWISGRWNRRMGGPTLEKMVIVPKDYGVSGTTPFIMYYIQRKIDGLPHFWTGERFHLDRRRVKLFFTASEAVQDFLQRINDKNTGQS